MAVRDSSIRFSRKSLKGLESIAARIDEVSGLMRAVDSPVKKLEAFRMLENLSLELHNFYRELMNDFRGK